MYEDSLLQSAASHVIATCAYFQFVPMTPMYFELLLAATPCVSQPPLWIVLDGSSFLIVAIDANGCQSMRSITDHLSGRLNLSEHDNLAIHPEAAD